jgi:hypothetical protein
MRGVKFAGQRETGGQRSETRGQRKYSVYPLAAIKDLGAEKNFMWQKDEWNQQALGSEKQTTGLMPVCHQ